MMTTANGRVDHHTRPVDMGVLLPERRDVVVNETTYQAWVVTNKRYPRRVQATLDAALARYLRVVGPILRLGGVGTPDPDHPDDPTESPGPPEPRLPTPEEQQALDEHDIAYQDYLTECISALVPDLARYDPEAIEVMPTNAALHLLSELGYMPEPKKESPDQPDLEREPGAVSAEDDAPLAGTKRRRASPRHTRGSPTRTPS